MADGRDRKKARVLRKPGVSRAVQDWRDAQAAKNALGEASDMYRPAAQAWQGNPRLAPRTRPPEGVPRAVQDWRDAQAAKSALGQVSTQFGVTPNRNGGRPSPWSNTLNADSAASALSSYQPKKLDYGNIRREGISQAMKEAQQVNGVNFNAPRDAMYLEGRDGPNQQMIDNYRSGRYIYSGMNMYNPTREGLEGGPDTVVPTSFGGGTPNKHNGARGDGSYKWDTFKNSIGGSSTDREDVLKEGGRSVVKPYKKTHKRIKKLF